MHDLNWDTAYDRLKYTKGYLTNLTQVCTKRAGNIRTCKDEPYKIKLEITTPKTLTLTPEMCCNYRKHKAVEQKIPH